MRASTKKLAAALAAGALLLTACSSGGGDDEVVEGAGHQGDVPSWCGDGPEIALAYADGFGGNGWKQIAAESARQEAEKCPNVVSFEYVDGQGDTQKAISDIQGLVATGVDALIVFPDAGEAVLPAIRSAYEADVVTVPFRTSPGGEAGTDYDVWVGADFQQDGRDWGSWIAENFPDGAKILFLSGPAGTSQGLDERAGLEEFLSDEKYEMIGEQPFEVTNWDPAETQQVLSAAIGRYPEIDVIVSDFGPSLVGALPQFASSGRSIPAVVASDGNALGCFYEDNVEANEDFELVTVNTGIDNVRLAVQHAVALATGGEPPAETMYAGGIVEDSTSDDLPVQCDPSLPGEVYMTSEMSGEDQAEIIGR